MGARDMIVLRNNQYVFRQVIGQYLGNITYADEYATTLRLPAYEVADVATDPEINFGRPHFTRTGNPPACGERSSQSWGTARRRGGRLRSAHRRGDRDSAAWWTARGMTDDPPLLRLSSTGALRGAVCTAVRHLVEDVETIDDRYGTHAAQSVPDIRWITDASADKRVLIGSDRRITRNPLERRAICLAKAR